jgi:hypothetical protein
MYVLHASVINSEVHHGSHEPVLYMSGLPATADCLSRLDLMDRSRMISDDPPPLAREVCDGLDGPLLIR